LSLRGQERQEFSQKVRKAAFARACRNGIPYCENCGIELRAGNIEYEHIRPDGLQGDPTLENCGCWCRSSCSRKKTDTEDNPRMAKADMVLKKSYGLQAQKQKIMGAGFRKAKPQRTASRPIERRTY
jgi:5-methylcytosine-specific restriction protein A